MAAYETLMLKSDFDFVIGNDVGCCVQNFRKFA